MHRKLERQLDESWYLRKPMAADREDSAEYQWQKKAVYQERRLKMAQHFERVRLQGCGRIGTDFSRTISGEGSVFVDFPTVDAIQNPNGRAYKEAQLIFPIENEDLTDFNRISFWLYADAPASSCNYLILALHNAGPEVMPVPGRFEGSHAVMGVSGKWQKVLWEIPHVARNCVTGISITSQAYGTSMPGKERIRIFYDDLRLEKVDPDHDKGFELAEGKIAYCHSGYRNGSRKQALIQKKEAHFCLLNEKQESVYEANTKEVKDGFYLLDFTDFETEGWYRIKTGGLISEEFPIGKEAYLSTAWKNLNFFFAERCGFSVPGIHTECHLDVLSVHPDGRKKSVAGGWHDAGDLTQDSKNTAESALAMMELGMSALKGGEKELGRRALEEARWGIDWMMKARWGDGYTHCGRIIGFWTQNIIGDCDDLETMAENRPHNNLLTAGVFARAAMVFQNEDPGYSAVCRRYAIEDYGFGVDGMQEKPRKSFSTMTPFQLQAQAALAAIELYRMDGKKEYLKDAVYFAEKIMNCQQRQIPKGFKIPLRGYFYESEEKKRTASYFHRSYEHVPIRAISLLLQEVPDHERAGAWRECLNLYGEYLKTIEKETVYGMFPAGIYELDNTDISNLYHEGDDSEGAPSIEEYNEQVKNGIMLDETHYLRIFPVAYQFRGFHAPIMGKAMAAMEIYRAGGDLKLKEFALRQMEWILGYNPFASSTVYGEGYHFHPLYAGVEPQIVGAVPVGIECYKNEDEPYWPVQNLATYKEIWVHTTCRLMRLIAYLGF